MKFIFVNIICFSFLSVSYSQTTETSRILDGCGGWITNSANASIVAGCQPLPVGFNTNASHLNHSGFLQTFLMHSNLDHDTDGIPDENDSDDDNDGLSDVTELSGNAFDPQTSTDPLMADTDDDGADDAMEAGAGTNPQDSESLLQITEFAKQNGELAVSWQSRDGYSYHLMKADTAKDINSNSTVAATVNASGGTPPWYETMSTGTTSFAKNKAFYRIAVTNGL